MTGDERLRWHVSWWRVLLVLPSLLLFSRFTERRRSRIPVLQSLREEHLTYTLLLLLFGWLLTYVVKPVDDPRTWPVILSGVVLIVAALGAQWISRRPWPSDAPPEVLASIYRTTYFVHLAFAMSVALWGFMDVFLTGWLWPYLVGASVALVWLWLVGPTAARIHRLELRLKEKNPTASLVEGLTAVPPGA
jgi:hypothetical protein